MTSKYTSRIASVLRWLGSAVLNIGRKDRVQALLSRYESLDKQLSDLYDAHRALLEMSLETEVMDKINADVDQADDLADQIRQAVGDLKAPQGGDTKQSDGSYSQALFSKLPQLDLPHFDGDLSQWVAYINLYESLVHSRRDFTPAQKLAYLMASLTGEPKGLVQHLDIVDANYEIARNLLYRRYQNVRLLADNHVSTILSLPKISGTQDLRLHLLNPLLVAINGLKRLELPVSSWCFLLLHIVLNKLSHDLRDRFDREYGGDSVTSLPRFDDLVLFLEDECRRVDNVPPPEASKVSQKTRLQPTRVDRRRELRACNANLTEPQKTRCNYCRDSAHRATSCIKFRQLRWQARRNIARQRNWCYYCLDGHLASQCPTPRPCSQCGGRHHLLLCGNQNRSTQLSAAPVEMPVPDDRTGSNGPGFPGIQTVPAGRGRGSRRYSDASQGQQQLPTGGGARSSGHENHHNSRSLSYLQWPRLHGVYQRQIYARNDYQPLQPWDDPTVRNNSYDAPNDPHLAY